jgi:uncharacterized RDD family membrane protein YckC
MIAHVLGSAFVNPVIETVDIDGVVRRIDINDVVRRIDIDEVINRIDIDRLLQRVDWNQVLQKVDVQAVVDRIDVESVVLRSNVSTIITQSTTGVFTGLLDALRIQVVVVDLYFLRASRGFWCCKRRGYNMLPQIPGGSHQENHALVPRERMNKAIAVQGRYSGFFAKGCGAFMDVAVVSFTFGSLLILFELCRMILLGQDLSVRTASESAAQLRADTTWRSTLILLAYGAYFWLYFFLNAILTGYTIGQGLVGIKIVQARDRSPVTACQALIRTTLLPLTLTFMPLLGLIGACRRDGRMLHDLVAGTGLVYKWNARLTKIRERALARMERDSSFYTQEGSSCYEIEIDDEGANVTASEQSPLIRSSQSGYDVV